MSVEFIHLKQSPKPKFGCFFVAAPALFAAALILWVVLA